MSKPKLVSVQLDQVKKLVRLLDQLQELTCQGCPGEVHEDSCPAHETWQMINYLKLRINHPNQNFTKIARKAHQLQAWRHA